MPPFFKAPAPKRKNAKRAPSRAPRKAAETEPITKSAIASAIRAALSGSAPGAWASDHLAESQRLTGFHYCAIHAKAKQCAAANIEVFEDRGEQRSQKSRLKSHGQEIPEHLVPLGEGSALVRLLSRPHPGCSASTFLYDIAQQHDMTGSALIVKVRNRAGLPVELYVIPTGAVQGMPPTPQYPNGFYQVGHNLVGSLWRDSQGFTELRGYQALSGAIIPPEDMIVIRWPHPILRDDGYGPITAGALWSDTALQVDQSRWSHLKNGINPSFGVTVDGDVTQQQINDALKGLDQNYAGSHNVGRPFVMPKGREIVPLSTTPAEMDYIGAFTQLRDAILALHGTPGVAAGITDGGSYAAFYAALKQFVTLTVQPLLDLIAGELLEQLAVEFEGDGRHYVIWLTAAAIDDPEVLERRLQTDIAARAIKKFEVRALRGLGRTEGDEEWAGEAPQPPAGAPPGAVPGIPAPDESSTKIPGVPKIEEAASPLTKAAPEPEVEAVEPPEESEPDPDHDTEDADIQAARDREDARIEADRTEEAAAIEAERNAEDARIEQQRYELAANGEDYDEDAFGREDAQLHAERDAADAARLARYDREDAELTKQRAMEDDGLERQRSRPIPKSNRLAKAACGALNGAWRSYP